MNRIDDSIAVGAIVGFVIGLLDCVKSKSDLVIADRTSTLPKLHRAIVVSKLCHVAETGICVCLAVVSIMNNISLPKMIPTMLCVELIIMTSLSKWW